MYNNHKLSFFNIFYVTPNLKIFTEYEITESLFGIFENTLGFSMTTEYDWSHTSSVTKSVTEEFQVNAQAPAGKVLLKSHVHPHTVGI